MSTASTSVSKTESPGSNPGAPASEAFIFRARILEGALSIGLFWHLGGNSLFKKVWGSVVEFLSDVRSELKKVSYPTKSETIGSTTVVLLILCDYVYVFVGSGFICWFG